VEDPGVVPFYCKHAVVGAFTVLPKGLAAGHDWALFRRFVGPAVFQARGDMAIMRQQGGFCPDIVRQLRSLAVLRQTLERHHCLKVLTAEKFDEGYNVRKKSGTVGCGYYPDENCHVKRESLRSNP
jgi:hypothetical protein